MVQHILGAFIGLAFLCLLFPLFPLFFLPALEISIGNFLPVTSFLVYKCEYFSFCTATVQASRQWWGQLPVQSVHNSQACLSCFETEVSRVNKPICLFCFPISRETFSPLLEKKFLISRVISRSKFLSYSKLCHPLSWLLSINTRGRGC